MNAKVFLTYRRPQRTDRYDGWLVRMDKLNADCQWLLGLDDRAFGGLMTGRNSAPWSMIDSYLKDCPRCYEGEAMNASFFCDKPEVATAQCRLHRLVLLVLLRAAGLQALGQTDVLVICDVAVLYGGDNEDLVKTWIGRLAENNASLVTQFIEFTKEILHLLRECRTSVAKLIENMHGTLDMVKSVAVMNFLVDLAVTLTSVQRFFPNAAFFFDQQSLTTCLPLFCQTVVIPLEKYLSTFQDKYDVREFKGHLIYAKRLLLGLFRELVKCNYFDRLTAVRFDQDAAIQIVGSYFNIMRQLVASHDFAAAYEKKYPFREDLRRLLDECDTMASIYEEEVTYLKNKFASFHNSPPLLLPGRDRTDAAVARIREIVSERMDEAEIRELLKQHGGNEERATNAIMDAIQERSQPGPSTRRAFEKSAFAALQTDVQQQVLYVPLAEGKKRGSAKDGQREPEETQMLRNFYANYVQTLDADEARLEYSDEYDDTYDE